MWNQSIGVPMPGIDKATGRVVAVIVLLLLAAAALRGYLPGGDRPSRGQPPDSPAGMFAIAATLAVSISMIAIAIVTQSGRQRRAAATAELPPARGGRPERPPWRLVLIALGAIVAWPLIVVLLMYALPQGRPEEPLPAAEPPARSGDSPEPALSENPEAGAAVLGYFATTTVILLLLIAAGTVIAARRQRRLVHPPAPDRGGYQPPVRAPASESFARAAELGLATIGDLNRDPRDAIIACYAAMERELENAPGAVPQDSDTPTEVLARAVEHHALHDDSATELVALFEEARFSPHPMNEGHRETAVRVLETVLTEISPRTGGTRRSAE